MNLPFAIVLGATVAGVPIAYHGESTLVVNGQTTQGQVWSDGIRTLRESTANDGTKSGGYSDDEKKLMWVYGNFPCVQIPLNPHKSEQAGELIGSENVDGHPTQKFKVSFSEMESGKSVTKSGVEWRATDLENLVVQWTKPDGSQFHLRHVVVGVPDAKTLTLPSQCKYDEAKKRYDDSQNTNDYAARAPGGFRTVSFFDLSCKKLVPLTLTFSLPSDFEIRQGGHMGCFAGQHDDLARLLKVNDQVDFDALKHAVIWVRTSDSTEFDPRQKHFITNQRTDDQWTSMYRQSGATDVKVIPRDLFGIASLRVTATVGAKTARMFYLGVGDSPAILISYQPAGNGTPGDETEWQRFLDSIAKTK